MLIGVRVETQPDLERVIIIWRQGTGSEWRAILPRLLDQRPATATLVEYVIRLYQRQMPAEAAAAGWPVLSMLVRMSLGIANGEEDAWEAAHVVE
ncbi:hypothetical protein Q3A66_16405 [Hymenobacter sp. BT770]|nr:hypothetical protein [Hymenobacter sp. BT770]MDO3416652.1 hypothetical protein [Hymenobacter sp. BT770]